LRRRNIDISEFIVSLTGLSSSYLPKEEKESIKKTLDIRLNGKTVMKVPEFDIAHARKRGDYIYIVQYDLIHDVQRVGKTPLDIIRNMLETGTILECLVDISAVGTLEDEPSNQIPFYVLFATIIEPDIIGSLFELDQERIQVFSGDGKTQKQPEVTGGSTMSVNTMESIFSQHSAIVPEDGVPEHAGSERGKPQQEAGTSIQHQKAPAQQGAWSGPPDASLRVNVHLLDSLMNLAGELVLSRNQLLEAVSHNDRRALRPEDKPRDVRAPGGDHAHQDAAYRQHL
jgi:two-component system, chemotaxis family, sensor kinase CheA